MRTIILGCESDHVSVRIRTITGNKQSIKTHKVRSWDELGKLMTDIKLSDKTDVVMSSSSMDFPKEYTSDKKVLALVRKIRSA